MLDVSGNWIDDASTVAGCVTVEELWIGGNLLTDLQPLLQMRSLTGVDLSQTDSNQVVDIEALRDRGVYVGGLA